MRRILKLQSCEKVGRTADVEFPAQIRSLHLTPSNGQINSQKSDLIDVLNLVRKQKKNWQKKEKRRVLLS